MAVFAMVGDPKDSARPRARESDSGRRALILELTSMTRLSPLLAKTPRWLSGARMCPDPCPPHPSSFAHRPVSVVEYISVLGARVTSTSCLWSVRAREVRC